MKKIVVGLSGGVDSAVSLFLIKEAFRDNSDVQIEAVFMKNWDSFINNDMSLDVDEIGCESNRDYQDAEAVANQLGIKLQKIEFIQEYWDYVFNKSLDKFKVGLTPNPDVLCNKYIKFDFFEKYVVNTLHADFFVMGHYAGKRINDDGSIDLIRALDDHKDQTYFLCELNQEQLKKALFPLQNITKPDVRRIAKAIKLPNADKKDSTGICFVGNREFKKFLSNYIDVKQGPTINLETGEVVGTHDGVWFYTIGQRKRIGLSGMDEKFFVAKKDIDNNTLYVSPLSKEEEFLFCRKIKTSKFNWINKIPEDIHCFLRYRHCGELHPVTFEILDDGILITSSDDLKAVPLGQYAVLYQGDICLGGGEIIDKE